MGLRTIVCIKSVVTSAAAGSMVRSADAYELNPFDRPALEVALEMRERLGGTVTGLSMGPEPCAFVLREAMAMGIDSGILLCDPAFAGSDTLATSTVLASAIRKLAPFDLILFGTRSSDSDTGHVGPQTAVLLDLPMVTGVCSIKSGMEGFRVERRMDGFREAFEVLFPAGLTIHPASVRPRDTGLLGMKAAFEERQVMKWGLEEVGLSPDRVGKAGSATAVISQSKVDRSRKCEFLTGSHEEQSGKLVERLLESGSLW